MLINTSNSKGQVLGLRSTNKSPVALSTPALHSHRI